MILPDTMPITHHLARVVLFQLLIYLVDRGFTRNVNFHNVRPPMSPTPFPNSFKCFTCNSALNNYECNRWAEDKWCPQHTEYCLTVHRFTSHGRSESVSKRCVSKEECQSVGCRHISKFGYTECTSCCEGMICNIEVPTNHTNAVLVVKQLHMFSSSANRRILIIPWITVALLVILLV
ncbi:ly6/PLAUR domain-containing protein 6B isoform X1 [Scyliorhinus canicula]|uniref:ly6/PLAUR domain-containing protein 6B isoform X1 n=1 Tax=Scyliorhinus canicula TaxID=7830 RepID=UPI0018F723B0|nr:ly6/PLAUR domain-containing protein 6B isoform X1 [Scyliorhinus canicula]XP_038645914.1 ly6/PLAUR domain-containing protein 6B isoform X1 [Scyliorhinus canicula]